MPVRKWYLNEALASVRRLAEVIDELTSAEIMACLDLEASTQRRRSVIDRLIAQAVRLDGIQLNKRLQEKYHGNTRT